MCIGDGVEDVGDAELAHDDDQPVGGLRSRKLVDAGLDLLRFRAVLQPAVRSDFITFQRVASERAQSWETVHCGLYGPSYAVYGAVNRGEQGWAGIKTPKRYVHVVDSGYRDRKVCAPEADNSPGREVNDDAH